MTPLYAIFAATRLGASLELEQSGTQLAVNAVADINRTALAIQPQSVGRWYAELLVYGSGWPRPPTPQPMPATRACCPMRGSQRMRR